MRRTLCAALFDKVVQFSMKSMTETNSGKLISLISADLFIVERGLSVFPLNFAAPFISLFTCYLLYSKVGIYYTSMIFIIWAFTMSLQFLTTQKYKKVKG
jgi:multidrug transporter EmrE-like cation transporter